MAEFVAVNQLKDFLNRLTKSQKIIIGAVLATVILGIGYIFINNTQKDMKVLFSNLEPQDASKISDMLKEKKIDFELKDNGATIMVPEEVVLDTRLEVAKLGLPESSNVGYELFDKTNLGMSEFVQKLNYRRALEGELAKTIAQQDEVKKARVHIVIPDKALFKQDQKEPTASVTLHLKSGRSVNNISVKGIQNLVASSVEGLKIENVIVMDSKSKILSEPAIDENSVAGLTATQHAQQQKIEEHLTSKVQSLLDNVLGAGNAQVRVNAELDFTRIEQTKTDFDPEKQVARSEQIINNKGQTADSLSYPYVNMAKDEQNTITNYEISKNVEHIIHSVGGIKRLSVSTLINGTVKVVDSGGIKNLNYTPRTNEELQKFTEIVKNAVGYDPSRNDQVTVLNVPFDYSDQEKELEDFYAQKWYQQPENQKIIFLLAAIIFTIILMVLIMQSKQVKNRLRIALSLSENIEIEDDLDIEEDEGPIEDLDFEDDELLLLPADLPEQLLLEGDKEDRELAEAAELEGGQLFDKEQLANRASADFDGSLDEVTEQSLMKLEIKNKVEEFIDKNTGEAVKILRMIMNQDFDSKNLRF